MLNDCLSKKKLKEIRKVLETFGIDVYCPRQWYQRKTYRPFSDVLADLALVWDRLTEEEKREFYD